MITVKVGDLLDSRAQTLVNTVNCVGVMGKGIALEFRKRFPEMYEDYVRRCGAKLVKLGEPYLYRSLTPPWILNFPTKDHWRSVSRIQDIASGLRYLEAHYREWGITSLAVPPLGCGQGQLEWRIVGPLLYKSLNALTIPVELYAPHGTRHEEMVSSFLGGAEASIPSAPSPRVYRIEPAWIAIVDILRRVEEEPYHWPVGRTTFQKIAYFATVSGLPTGLHYRRGSFGPYAADLKPRTTALVNNGLVREERVGRMFAVRVGQAYGDAKRNYARELEGWQRIIEKVSDLFLRMNTQQAEAASTVHYAAEELRNTSSEEPSEKDVLQAVMEWKHRRRPPLSEVEVAVTIRNLNMLSWIGARASQDLPVPEEELLHV